MSRSPLLGSKAAVAVLVGAFVVLLFNAGQRFSIGLFLKPMVDDLGWTRSTLSLAVTAFLVISALGLPFAGRFVDVFGAAPVLGVSAVVAGIATALMAFIDLPWQAFVLYGVIFAIGSAGTSIAPVSVLVSQWFPDRVGLASSVAISGMGVGQVTIITVLSANLADIGWRNGFWWLGATSVIVVVPIVVAVARLSPGRSTVSAATGPIPTEGVTTVWAALKTRPLWILFGFYAFCGMQDFLVATHIVAFSLDQNLAPSLAGNLLAFMGLAGLVGVLVTGFVTDRKGPIPPTMACFALRVVLFAMVIFSKSPIAIGVFAMLYGLTFWITAPLTVVFVRDIYGTAMLGTLAGMVTMVHHAFGGIGAYVGAYSFDLTGSYDSGFAFMVLTSAVAIVLVMLLPARRA